MPMLFYRPFRTRGVYANFRKFQDMVRSGFETEIGPNLAGLHREQVDYWREEPDFTPKIRVTEKAIEVTIHVSGRPARIWRFLSDGVEAREIVPRAVRTTGRGTRAAGRSTGRRRRALRFPDAGGDIIFRSKVNWPGISPRRYPERVAEEYGPEFRTRMELILRRAVRAMQR